MRRALLSAPLLFTAFPVLAAEPPSQPAWPRIRKARIQKLLPEAMRRANVDAWVVICRRTTTTHWPRTSAVRTREAPPRSSS